MAETFQYDVFLSHSSADKAVVRAVAERLRKDGLKVWFDEWMLKPGESILAKIEEGLELSRVLVLCMSANAFVGLGAVGGTHVLVSGSAERGAPLPSQAPRRPTLLHLAKSRMLGGSFEKDITTECTV
jgi:TIR domain